MSFSQLPAVEKDTENSAPEKFLGPSYFEATLALTKIYGTKSQTFSPLFATMYIFQQPFPRGYESLASFFFFIKRLRNLKN